MVPSDFWYEIDDIAFGFLVGLGGVTVILCVLIGFYHAGKRIFGGRDG